MANDDLCQAPRAASLWSDSFPMEAVVRLACASVHHLSRSTPLDLPHSRACRAAVHTSPWRSEDKPRATSATQIPVKMIKDGEVRWKNDAFPQPRSPSRPAACLRYTTIAQRGSHFVDQYGRILQLRGFNVSAASKLVRKLRQVPASE